MNYKKLYDNIIKSSKNFNRTKGTGIYYNNYIEQGYKFGRIKT